MEVADMSEFQTFHGFCNHTSKYLTSTNTRTTKYIYYITDRLQVIYGLPNKEVLGLVKDFFLFRKWEEYSDLVYKVNRTFKCRYL